MKRVILESPYGSKDSAVVDRNTRYARAAMLDALKRGEAPMVSHLLYTQVLDDNAPDDRKLAIEGGLAWGPVAEATVVYTDLGITAGMENGIARAHEQGRDIETRKLNGEWASA